MINEASDIARLRRSIDYAVAKARGDLEFWTSIMTPDQARVRCAEIRERLHDHIAQCRKEIKMLQAKLKAQNNG